ncbi:hypothetical protein QBC43DRAFT_304038 [Cladorrhinum sp. PSN259]|nr:hypothetical protein QBC43DRAFT_304038 [Cladorrhinum sp. PSN259]
MQTTANTDSPTAPLPPQQALTRDPPPYTETDSIGHISNISTTTTLREDGNKAAADNTQAPPAPEKTTVGKSTFYIVDLEIQDPNGQAGHDAQQRRRFRPSGWMTHRLSPVGAAMVDGFLFAMTGMLFCCLLFVSIHFFSADSMDQEGN